MCMSVNRFGFLRIGLVSFACCLAATSFAAEWRITPQIAVQEVYSDNIFLIEGNEQEDYVTSIAPAVSVIGNGNKLNLQLNYQLQNLIYARESDLNSTNHNLDFNANSELIDEHFFINASARAGQVLQDARGGGSADAISGAQNLSDGYGFSISPRWEQRLGRIANLGLSYTHDRFYTDENGNRGSNGGDSQSDRFGLNLVNGTNSANTFWSVNAQSSETDYDDGDSSEQESASGEAGFYFVDEWAFIASATYQNNSFRGGRGSTDPDDSYYGGGLRWTPSAKLDLSVQYNSRLDPRPDEDAEFISGQLRWTPSLRTDLSAEFGQQFFGETYNFALNHRSRRSSVALRYENGTTNFRDQFLGNGVTGSLICPIGSSNVFECRNFDQNNPPQLGEELVGTDRLPTSISSDVYRFRRPSLDFNIRGGHNNIGLGVSYEEREFLADAATEDDLTYRINWGYRVSPQAQSQFSVQWIERTFEDNQQDEILDVNWTVSRTIGANSQLALQLSHTDRSGTGGGRGTGNSNLYDENRITLSFNKTFR